MIRYGIPHVHRYELAARIGLFLVRKGMNSWDTWVGKLNKAEQINAFGFYMGRGSIEVNGQKESVEMNVKVCFGIDISSVFFASAQTGWLCCESGRKAPIEELNLYSSLNELDQVAA